MKATCQHCGHTFDYPAHSTCPNCGDIEKREKSDGKKFAHHKAGKRTIGGNEIYFPNQMEANYYRYLHWMREHGMIADFEYQPDYLDFTQYGFTHGTTRYRPDFKVTEKDGSTYYVETKGWLDAKSKTKLKRAREYSKVRVNLVLYREYKQLEKQISGLVPEWER